MGYLLCLVFTVLGLSLSPVQAQRGDRNPRAPAGPAVPAKPADPAKPAIAGELQPVVDVLRKRGRKSPPVFFNILAGFLGYAKNPETTHLFGHEEAYNKTDSRTVYMRRLPKAASETVIHVFIKGNYLHAYRSSASGTLEKAIRIQQGGTPVVLDKAAAAAGFETEKRHWLAWAAKASAGDLRGPAKTPR